MSIEQGNDEKPYIIAEVGQNHQGSVEFAEKYIIEFAKLGANAVKFQLRDNHTLFDSEMYNMKYQNSNSFGSTYGEHRDHLELEFEELVHLKEVCDKVGVDFIITPFDENSLARCLEIRPSRIKIASFDIGNLPFLNRIRSSNIPVVMSTGGGDQNAISHSVDVFQDYIQKIWLLHCTSLYPCPADKLSLQSINYLRDRYPNCIIGLSDHFNGILSGPLAYMLGARIFEKHVTFDRSLKGSDHCFALEPDGFRRFVRDIVRTPIMLEENTHKLGNEPIFKRLGKSIIASEAIDKGMSISCDNITGMIIQDPNGIPVRESASVIGKRLNATVVKGQPIFRGMIEW